MRLDQLLVHKGLAASRTQSQKMISNGQVSVKSAGRWQKVSKPSAKYDTEVELSVEAGDEQRFVSRAGLKLQGALEWIGNENGYSAEDKTALDVGQSTGGFTDCLLKQGVARVIGVDVGHGQLVKAVRDDPRVTCLEGVNARHLSVEDLIPHLDPPIFDLAVMDVSFISQMHILPQIAPLLAPGGILVSLVKPQFEVGPEGIGKGGIVKNEKLYRNVEEKLCTFAPSLGLTVRGYFESSIQGGDGNREFFMWSSKA